MMHFSNTVFTLRYLYCSVVVYILHYSSLLMVIVRDQYITYALHPPFLVLGFVFSFGLDLGLCLDFGMSFGYGLCLCLC